MTGLRSLLFTLAFYLMTAVICVLFILPVLILPQSFARIPARLWAQGTFLLLRIICGITYEIRGKEHISDQPLLYACKHQSAWETMAFWILLEKPVFVLKKELVRIPLYGQILKKLGSISIDRDGGMDALKQMIADAKQRIAAGRPIIIFPEGTRTLPGAAPQYHSGVAALYAQLKVPLIPVALNSGLFWSKHRFLKPAGNIIMEFLPPIPSGMKSRELMPLLEETIETACKRLG